MLNDFISRELLQNEVSFSFRDVYKYMKGNKIFNDLFNNFQMSKNNFTSNVLRSVLEIILIDIMKTAQKTSKINYFIFVHFVSHSVSSCQIGWKQTYISTNYHIRDQLHEHTQTHLTFPWNHNIFMIVFQLVTFSSCSTTRPPI